jgi:fused signal recognition particle receptor
MKKKLAERIRALFSSGAAVSDETFEDLEDALIEGDVGVMLASEAVDELRDNRSIRNASREVIVQELKQSLGKGVRSAQLPIEPGRLHFMLVLGVNGVGKTTAIARIAHRYRDRLGADKIILCAGDTFRAAAIDQLQIHADRLGVRIIRQNHGSDSAAVIYDAIESAKARRADLVLADTAGRMHNKADLVGELAKIDRIIRSRGEGAWYHKLLVIDATTGQNGLRQAEVFHEAIGIDSILISKYDSSGKGGIALSIARQLDIPFSFLGTGETYESLEPFDVDRYLDSLVG